MIIEENKQVNHSFMLFLKLTKNKEVIKLYFHVSYYGTACINELIVWMN